jgi:hypothetical protein
MYLWVKIVILVGDITSSYSLDGQSPRLQTCLFKYRGLATLSTDENGSFTGVFNISANTFKTGERVFKVDNRLVVT